MRTRQSVVVALLVVCGLAMAAGTANADTAPWISDSNLLANDPVLLNWGTNAGYATDLDGTAALFNTGNPVQQMEIYGFNSAIGTIRLWVDTTTNGNGAPLQASIWSSTNANNTLTSPDLGSSGNTANHFETLLAGGATPVTLGNAAFTCDHPEWWAAAGYHEFTVNAPAGTQSLYFNFYGGNAANGNTGGVGIIEAQAFAPTPEPSSLVLLACGLIALLAYAWRKRK